MSPSPISINVLRYLIVWRVNHSLVWLPRALSVDLSLVLGTCIANRLSTNEAAAWRKALAPLQAQHEQSREKNTKTRVPIPSASWPIDAVLLVYPGKSTYGKDELIFWELKLLGASADHVIFLELILPAMEEAGFTSNPAWRRINRLWGHFDVHEVYVARGPRWEPLVRAGRLDLRYRPTPAQWVEGLQFGAESKRSFQRLDWLTPFAFTENSTQTAAKKQARFSAPGAKMILDHLLFRASHLLPGKHHSPTEIIETLNADQKTKLEAARAEAATIFPVAHDLKPVDSNQPGECTGSQTFSSLPYALLPYLDLAAILHVGQHTHFGCGTFVLG